MRRVVSARESDTITSIAMSGQHIHRDRRLDRHGSRGGDIIRPHRRP